MKRLFVILTILSLFSSCRRSIDVSIDTDADTVRLPEGFPKKSSFVILPLGDSGAPLVSEIQHAIEEYLGEFFDYEVFSGHQTEKADYLLFFSFEKRKIEKIVQMPVNLPGKMNRQGKEQHFPRRPGRHTIPNRHQDYYFFRGPGRFHTMSKHIIVITGTLAVEVYPVAERQDGFAVGTSVPLWKGTAEISGREDDDERLGIAFLVKGLFSHIGYSTEKEERIRFESNDEEVRWLREETERFFIETHSEQ